MQCPGARMTLLVSTKKEKYPLLRFNKRESSYVNLS